MDAIARSITSRFGSSRERPPTLSRRRPAQAGWKVRKTVLHHNVQELLVFEINHNGDREYKNMTLRTLYNYVLAAIASKPSHLKPGEKASDSVLMASRAGLADSMCHNVDLSLKRPSSASSLGSFNESEVRKRRPRYDSVTDESFASSATGNVEVSVRSVSQDADSKRVSFHPPTQSPKQQLTPESDTLQQTPLQHVTYRERLGGYLHPRDMRRLVTPFSASNEPELIVRRHVMLLNFDPLRAIVLRDRLLVLVPDGADSILESLANRIKGGMTDMEDSVFGKEYDRSSTTERGQSVSETNDCEDEIDISTEGTYDFNPAPSIPDGSKRSAVEDCNINVTSHKFRPGKAERRKSGSPFPSENDSRTESMDLFDDDEWGDLQGKAWIDLPFELQSVDAVLHTVSLMLTDEANDLQEYSYHAVESLLEPHHTLMLGDSGGGQHDVMRSIKGEISQMTGRLQGFVRAINQVLDDDEDLALMNLSRLITHPERFIQPVPQEVLHEESDEPELILEAYLQQALSNTNALDLLRQEVAGSEELMNMKLDTVRNRLLYVNTVVSLLTLAVGTGSFIGSIFGMNLYSGLEEEPHAFKQVVLGTCFGVLSLLLFLVALFYRAGTIPKVSTEYLFS